MMTIENLKQTDPRLYNEIFTLGVKEASEFLRSEIDKISSSPRSLEEKLNEIENFCQGNLNETLTLIAKFKKVNGR